ncbi:MAG: D-glycerate dehydrogenase [Rhodobiaceae bacterium]|nr:D-glycerate dehydrogenase [Rhodobiaceae bacterium]MCC0051761.1 D-glycerate dehydrogenase [Rhodobiaceae bacterium]MCC0060444.1 D-glycerate dehydrogenase [Rhodobiaceae bacterium]
MLAEKPVLWITRKLSDNTMARARASYDVIDNPEDRTFTADEIVAMSAKADAILPCHSEVFDAGVTARLSDRVRIIANHSVGVDHCDLPALKARGIAVTNTPDVLSDATAEIAILLMLGAARRASEGERLIRAGQWTDWSPSFMVGRQVTGKRFGVLGMGRVGRVAAMRARGFGMEIHYHNRNPVEGADGAIYHGDVEEFLSVCDVLSIHCPATDTTRGLLNRERLELLPADAIVVNTARGAIVDDDALIDALKRGRIFAAGLDVFNGEPRIHHGYASLENVFLLPHIGSATTQTRDAMGFRALDNLDAFFAGQDPGDRVA